MKALLIETLSSITYPFIEGLHEATNCRVIHAHSLEAGVTAMEAEHFDLVLMTLDQDTKSAYKCVERLRSCELSISTPSQLIVLPQQTLELEDVLKCRDPWTMCLPRESWKAIYSEARTLFGILSRRKLRTTIRIECRNGQYTLYFSIGANWEEMLLGSRLIKTALIVAGRKKAYTVEFVADDLGVCVQSVKKYFHELNREITRCQRRLCVAQPEEEIFWMQRQSGGTLCGIRANIEWA